VSDLGVTVFALGNNSILLLGDCLDFPPLHFTEEVGKGVTSLWHTVRLVYLSSSILSPLMYFHLPPHRPSSSNFFFTPLSWQHGHDDGKRGNKKKLKLALDTKATWMLLSRST